MNHLQLTETDGGFRAQVPLMGPVEGILGATDDLKKMSKRVMAAFVFGLVGCFFLAVLLIEPCFYSQTRGGLGRACFELSYREQVLHPVNYWPTLFIFGVAILQLGLPGLRYLLERVVGGRTALELVVTDDRVVAMHRGKVAYDASRSDTRLVVEGPKLVLVCRSEQAMHTWQTRAAPMAMQKLVQTMGDDAAVLSK